MIVGNNKIVISLKLINLISTTLQDSLDYQKSYNFIKDSIDKTNKKSSKDYDYSKSELYRAIYRKIYNEYFGLMKDYYKVENDAQKDAIRVMYDLQYILLSMNDTSMSKEIENCFMGGKLDGIPHVINQEIKKRRLNASDISFLKISDVMNNLDGELSIPRELRKSIEYLNLETAVDIMKNNNIYYDMEKHCFVNELLFAKSIGVANRAGISIATPKGSTANSKELNVICSGTELLNRVGNDELFTEDELMDFCTFLSLKPMLGPRNEVGERIWNLIETLHQNEEKSINFDKERYYHCRSHRMGEMPYTFEEMLQAPHGIPWAGRFNHVGRSCYYFSDTRYGAEVEVKSHLKREEELQTVIIRPINDATLLDLSGTLRRGERFLKYIRFKVPEDDRNKVPKQYLIPCYVADCCKDIGFNGIKYYGSKDYMNYVCWNDGYFDYVDMLLPGA